MLSEEELQVFQRGKNQKPQTRPKHATVEEYRMATGFECVIGYWHLEQRDRLNEMMHLPESRKLIEAHTAEIYMIVYLTALLFILTIGVVTFPLFFSRIQRHELQKAEADLDTSESDALLSALSELEDDFQLGRLNKDEYQQQKIRLQRQYLKLKETPENG